MQKHSFKIEKTARFYTLGELNSSTKNIWIVLHGYGQLAQYFIKKFEHIVSESTVIVAPEALNRYYFEGFKGRVGASWMTSDDRETDIADYVNYLNTFFKNYIQSVTLNSDCKITVLGFSQGAATACRWVNSGVCKINRLILWSGSFPYDLNFDLETNSFKSIDLFLVIGNKDELADIIKVEEHKAHLEKMQLNYSFIEFDGGHELNKDVIKKIANL